MKGLCAVGFLVWLNSALLSTAEVFTVTNPNDVGPGSLRQAILNANAATGADVIEFNLPGSGVRTIAPLSAFPEITDAVAINGYSQPGSQANTAQLGGVNAVLLVRLDGRLITNGLPAALSFNHASGSSVRGLVIVRFDFGIEIYDSSNVTLAGNWIGMDIDGVARGMTFDGVSISCPVFNQASNNRIGGTSPADRNIISGNGTGISISGQSIANCSVLGNLVGTDPSGRLPRGNLFAAVEIQGATNITVGDGSLGGRNLLNACTGAGGSGVSILGGGGHLILGNAIGTDFGGFFDLGNSSDGVMVQGAKNVRIRGNQITANRGNGIQLLGASGCVIEWNAIGSDSSSPTIFPLGNTLAGVRINGDTNRVGSLVPWEGNVIEYNGGPGVAVVSGVQNEITGNDIYDNGGLGIDLGFSSGVTPNDDGDADTGPNLLQNFPQLVSANNIYGSLFIAGTLNSSPSSSFRIELFASPAFDPEWVAEGQLLLGVLSISTDGNGNASFDANLTNAPPADYLVTATATDARGNTSEFSPGIAITPGPMDLSLVIQRSMDNSVTMSWPAAATFYQLETTVTLSPSAQWQKVGAGITTAGGWKQFVITNSPAGPNQFYRLRKP